MMRIAAVVFAILIAVNLTPSVAAEPEQAALDREIARFLTALNWGKDAKEEYAAVAARGELDAYTARLLGEISERRFVELAVPQFRSIVSLEEATAMAEFYESDAMRAMLKEQKRTPDSPPVATTREQAAAVQAFLSSQAGQAAQRMQKALSESAFAENFAAALEQELQAVAKGQ